MVGTNQIWKSIILNPSRWSHFLLRMKDKFLFSSVVPWRWRETLFIAIKKMIMNIYFSTTTRFEPFRPVYMKQNLQTTTYKLRQWKISNERKCKNNNTTQLGPMYQRNQNHSTDVINAILPVHRYRRRAEWVLRLVLIFVLVCSNEVRF